MNPSPILFIYLFFITSILSPIHATQATTDNVSFRKQCSVAFKRQEAGIPFDDPMPAEDGWGAFFTQGVRRVQNLLDSRQEILNDRKDKLSLMLHQVSSMGDELFAEGEMDTHWYFFLHRLMGEILTRSYEDPSLPFAHLDSDFRDPADFDGLIDTFKVQRMLRRDHLTEAREITTLIGKYGYNPQETLIIDGNSFSAGIVKNALPIKYDCFFLPFIGTPRQTLFPIDFMNKALAHRICLIGIPTEPADYDAAQNRPPSEFLNHDLGHGRLFSYLPGVNIDCFSLEKDPILKKIHPIWEKTSQTTGSFYKGAFFMAVHEGYWSILDNIFRYTNLTKLEEALETELNADPKLEAPLEDFANDEFTFYSNFLRKKNESIN